MKKILLFAFIVLCGFSAMQAQDIVNLRMDRQQMGLRGYVASMDEDILLRKDYFREDWPTRKWFVNDLRNVLREENGRIVTFNQNGRMTTITYTYQGKPGRKTTCSYASNGLLTSFLGEGYRVEAKYKGNSADINVYAETKDYSSSVNLAKADLNTAPYTNSYPFDLKCRQELSDDGLVLKSSYFYVDSMPARVCEYSYNHLNLLVGEKITANDVVSTVRYTYDNKGFLVKKEIRSLAAEETYTYENNELGDCVRVTIERPYGTSVYTYEYVYDTMDNWTVRLQFLDGVFDNAALRTLTYYKAPKSDGSSVAKKEKKKDSVDKKKKKQESSADVDKEQKAKEKQAAKEQKAREKQAAKEAKEREKALKREQAEREKAMQSTMTPEQKKAEKKRLAEQQKAEKKRLAEQKKAEKERMAAEKRYAKERAAAEKKAAKERAAAEKKAAKERAAADKKSKKK